MGRGGSNVDSSRRTRQLGERREGADCAGAGGPPAPARPGRLRVGRTAGPRRLRRRRRRADRRPDRRGPEPGRRRPPEGGRRGRDRAPPAAGRACQGRGPRLVPGRGRLRRRSALASSSRTGRVHVAGRRTTPPSPSSGTCARSAPRRPGRRRPAATSWSRSSTPARPDPPRAGWPGRRQREALPSLDTTTATARHRIAGAIAAATDNGQGGAGTAPGARLLIARALDDAGDGRSPTDRAVIWAADSGARVIDLSLAGRTRSEALADAIKYAQDRGALTSPRPATTATAPRPTRPPTPASSASPRPTRPMRRPRRRPAAPGSRSARPASTFTARSLAGATATRPAPRPRRRGRRRGRAGGRACAERLRRGAAPDLIDGSGRVAESGSASRTAASTRPSVELARGGPPRCRPRPRSAAPRP